MAAFALYLGWAVTAFGVRALIHRRRTGDTGFRGLSDAGGPARWAGIGFVLAVLAGLAAPVAAMAGLGGIPGADGTPTRVAGLVVALAGVALTLVAQSGMGASWRVGVDERERTELVTGGLFGWVRNPVFTAMVVTAFGLALMVPNVVALLALVSLVAAVQAQVRVVEEPFLRSVHGAAYEAYTRRTGRFVPGVGR